MKEIRNLIFDLGDVLINLDNSKILNLFGRNISTFYDDGMNPDFVDISHKFEKGQVSADEFRTSVLDIFDLKLSDDKFDYYWNSIIADFPTARRDMLKNLNEKYRVFLLSNTNEIHYNYFTKKDYWNFEIFEKTYFSQLMNMRKPEPEIFEFVLKENNLMPEQTVFFDDNIDNVKSAKSLGINAVLVENNIIELVRDLNLY